MKSKNKHLKTHFRLAICFLMLLSSVTVFGQKSFKDIAEMKQNKWNSLVKLKHAYISNIYALEGLISSGLLKEENTPNPENIGILTFQLWDESTMKSQKAGDWVYYTKNFISEEGSNIISNKILEVILPSIKEEFTNAGFNLLEPNEFRDNE